MGLWINNPVERDIAERSNVTPITPRGHRTPEQIQAQLEARYAEMAVIAASPAKQFPCKACRYWHGSIYEHCTNPLVVGFGKPEWCWDKFPDPDWGKSAKLCGPEKALWEPRLSLWQRFIDWFLEPWKGAN